jgi:hypothetical protein
VLGSHVSAYKSNPVWDVPDDPYLYHAAPTVDRARIQTHGLIPSEPGRNSLWAERGKDSGVDEQPEGVYLAPTWQMAASHFKGEPVDVWRVPKASVQRNGSDPLLPAMTVVYHPVQAELHKGHEDAMSHGQWREIAGIPDSIGDIPTKDVVTPPLENPQWGIGRPDRVIGKTADWWGLPEIPEHQGDPFDQSQWMKQDRPPQTEPWRSALPPGTCWSCRGEGYFFNPESTSKVTCGHCNGSGHETMQGEIGLPDPLKGLPAGSENGLGLETNPLGVEAPIPLPNQHRLPADWYQDSPVPLGKPKFGSLVSPPPCPTCGGQMDYSHDQTARYDDGYAHCPKCQRNIKINADEPLHQMLYREQVVPNKLEQHGHPWGEDWPIRQGAARMPNTVNSLEALVPGQSYSVWKPWALDMLGHSRPIPPNGHSGIGAYKGLVEGKHQFNYSYSPAQVQGWIDQGMLLPEPAPPSSDFLPNMEMERQFGETLPEAPDSLPEHFGSEDWEEDYPPCEHCGAGDMQIHDLFCPVRQQNQAEYDKRNPSPTMPMPSLGQVESCPNCGGGMKEWRNNMGRWSECKDCGHQIDSTTPSELPADWTDPLKDQFNQPSGLQWNDPRNSKLSALPPDRIWRGELRPVDEDPAQAASVGMHWTEDPSAALVNYRTDEPHMHNVMWQARRTPEAEIAPGHPIWQGRGRPMSWEREVRLKPGQQAQIEGHYTWQGEGSPKPFTLREHGENYDPNWAWTPMERSLPVEHQGWIPYKERHPDLFKSGSNSRRAATPSPLVPPEPGTTPIPDGHVRLYHYTQAPGDVIANEGLRLDKAKGETYGEPNGVWASAQQPDPYQHRFVEFSVPFYDKSMVIGGPTPGVKDSPEDFMARGSNVAFNRDITPQEFIAIHEPWHSHYRYLQENYPADQNPDPNQFDWASEDPAMGPAVAAWKQGLQRTSHWESLVKRACEIAEDDGIDSAGDFLFEASGDTDLAADFMRQYAKVFSAVGEEERADASGSEPAGEDVEANHSSLLSKARDDEEDERHSKQDQDGGIDVHLGAGQEPAADSETEDGDANEDQVEAVEVEHEGHGDRLAKLTELVAAMAAEKGQRRKLVVNRDEQGRIASIEEA